MVTGKKGGPADGSPPDLKTDLYTSVHRMPPAGNCNPRRVTRDEPPIELEAHRLVDVRTVARTIGVSPRTLWRWCEAGHFPRPELSIGETRRWRLKTVRAWIEQQTGGAS